MRVESAAAPGTLRSFAPRPHQLCGCETSEVVPANLRLHTRRVQLEPDDGALKQSKTPAPRVAPLAICFAQFVNYQIHFIIVVKLDFALLCL